MNIVRTLDGGFLTLASDLASLLTRAASDAASKQSDACARLDGRLIPSVSRVAHTRLAVHCHTISYGSSSGEPSYNAVLEITMPCGENSLLWMPWLPHQAKPVRFPGQFHHLNFGKFVLMPRRTKCYGIEYHFSNQSHPLETNTPPEIEGLYRETNAIFGLTPETGPNMCLENDYDCGRHGQAEHADLDKQSGDLKDVFCWVTGPARREAIFRVRKAKKGPENEALRRYCSRDVKGQESRELFSLMLPAGLYVMQGKTFQERYSHDFPQLHEKLFRRILRVAPTLFENDGFPTKVPLTDKGASQTTLVQASWLKENKDLVTQVVLKGKFSKSKGTEKADAEAFEEWCQERTSYTLRQFRPCSEVASIKKRKLSDV
ncbi:hypothetical protein BC830DRAFT_1152656 [Chytriomyces sp. MP71]|nr:hypothetical protein BC830DRAFT_1152656 [Chytriomyces sp. MP71]